MTFSDYLAYCTRPEDDVVMEPLVAAEMGGERRTTVLTSKQWLGMRSALYRNGGEIMRGSGARDGADAKINLEVETAALRSIR